MSASSPPRPPLTPAYWPGWIGVGFLWLMGRTPQWLALALSIPLAGLLRLAMKRRQRVAEQNVRACFPDLSPAERDAIVKGCFRSLARSVFEMTWSWSAPEKKILKLSEVNGLEHLLEARKAGKGVLMVTAHFTQLDIGARIVGCHFHDMKGLYRPLKSPVLEWYQTRGRTAYSKGMMDKRRTRDAIRWLRQGGVLWYAPDQDFGPKQSLFVPFFGIPTATLLATRRMPQMTGSKVVMMFPSYDEQTRRYRVDILPALENFPGESPHEDLALINALIEQRVRQAPGHYWWIHRRFKSRPEGEPPFYS